MKNRLSVILPTYNEAENIRPLIDAIKEALEEVHEVIVVDDDSPDKTWEVVEDMIKSGGYPFLRLEKRLKDHGLTKSIWRGIELATGDVVGWMDCDFSMSPKYLPVLLSLINADYDVAVGSRFVLGGRWRTEKRDPEDTIAGVVLSRLLNLFIQVCLDHRFKDYTSGFVVARKKIFDRIKLRGDYGEYFIDFIYRVLKLNYHVVEVPYVWRPRRAGSSKTGTSLSDYCRRGWKYIVTTSRLILTRKF
ncbi:MAG: glycosyltransferase [Candidatus Omnitrophica bacterium]|nr:glycosyltransferase [Candidatus Omnitrophota bacterium]MBU4590198.1 glycosyltransferase [Candidatus Omnitrophota bacterium]